MRKTITTLLLLWLTAFMYMAQEAKSGFTVKGTVTDSLTNEGEPYATIKITAKGKPEKAIVMAVTNKGGCFNETLPQEGSYVLSVSSIGRNPITKEFKLTAKKPTADLGTLSITDAKNSLSSVEVVAQKPLVKADIDKIEYNIEDDPQAQSSTVIEMLRKVPLVTVDGQDNIKVNGDSKFKVYVNGRPNSMMSKNPTEVLKSMPANTIKRIEVITNPGPKYDAEGIGGILNIVTTGQGMEGYTVTVGAKGSNTGAGGNIYGTIKHKKLTMSTSCNYNYNEQLRNYERTERTATDTSDPSASNLMSDGHGRSRSSLYSGNIEASYEIDTLRLVTASLSVWGYSAKTGSHIDYTAFSPLSGDKLYSYNMVGMYKGKWSSFDGSIDYQRSFSTKGRLLTLSYKINTESADKEMESRYDGRWASDDWQAFINAIESQHNNGDENTIEQTFQIDYTTPIGKQHTIETGAKYIMRNNKSNTDRYTRAADSTSDYTPDEDNSSHYRHENDIIAAYLGYGLKLGRLSGRIGLRYEHTFQSVKYLVGRGDDFRKEFDDFVPSLSMGYKINDETNVRLGYNMRIYRPSIYYLNPYIDDSDPTDISQGNSLLDSEKKHSFDLGLNHFTQKLTLNLTLRHSFTNNSIESYKALVNDETISGLSNPTGRQVIFTTYRNIGSHRITGLRGYISWNLTGSSKLYTNFSGSYLHYSDGLNTRNHGWQGDVFAGLEQSFKHDWRITAEYFSMTKQIDLQGTGMSFQSYGLMLSKQMLKKKLTLSAYAADFLKKYPRQYVTKTQGTGFTQTQYNKFSNMRFGIRIMYRIGDLKASVKKAERTISNDDVKEGEKKGQ